MADEEADIRVPGDPDPELIALLKEAGQRFGASTVEHVARALATMDRVG